jgi:hypothetical protein
MASVEQRPIDGREGCRVFTENAVWVVIVPTAHPTGASPVAAVASPGSVNLTGVYVANSVHKGKEEEAMHEGPRLKDTQLKILRDLLTKRGWDEATFARAARTPLEALNPSQAREWITKLTKATKGKPRATNAE